MSFDSQRWFKLDPERVVPLEEVAHPDLHRVEEVGFADLMPGAGHGYAGSCNVSWIEVYATPVRR